jgi:cellulose synthase/poly-beta-1,6-N-acetylglucosamine synthase-like glycosyltransferase/peptidoglycan/xylan/chitin deacetylase (PgdA/CDA1 family)/spore germination protein YaaH
VEQEHHPKPIFYDERGRRWPAILRAWAMLALVLSVLSAVFMATIIGAPPLRALKLPAPGFIPDPQRPPSVVGARVKEQTRYALALKMTRSKAALERHMRAHRALTAAPLVRARDRKPLSVVAGFYVNWDATSYASLTQNARALTHLMPEWLHLGKDGSTFRTEESKKVIDFCDKHNLPILPLLNNVDAGDFEPDRIHKLLVSDAAQAKLAQGIVAYLKKHKFKGLNLDIEGAADADRDLMSGFVYSLADALHANRLLLSMDVPLEEQAYDLAALGDACDFIVPMLYDQHDATGTAGPIAGQDWFEAKAKEIYTLVPPNKVVLGLGSYGYDWRNGQPTAHSMTYEEAVVTARDEEAKIAFDENSLNPHYAYTDDRGAPHSVWFLDAVTMYNNLRSQREAKPLGAALWVLGSEDPSVWSFFRRDKLATNTDSRGLRAISFEEEVDTEGLGEILSIASQPADGYRDISTDPTGYIRTERYVKYPSPYLIRLRGGDQRKSIALTFDDGPDPRWTPKILDILQHYHVPATFFVQGAQAEQHPDLVRREYAEGHEIGNHTFYHPDLSIASPTRVRLELDATQRAIQHLTGHSTELFRAPYSVDTTPTKASEIRPLLTAQALGYVTVGANIDPNDWARPGVKAILYGGNPAPGAEKDVETIDGVLTTAVLGLQPNADSMHIVLLHDYGGDRTQTIQALPHIIEGLRAEGFTFTTVSGLMGQSRDAVMPPVSGRDIQLVGVDSFVFDLIFGSKSALQWVFYLTLLLGVSRVLFTAAFALVQARRARREVFDPRYHPKVSVVIAAYNEAEVIERTVQAILGSDYDDVEIIVVDDGSIDDTSAVVHRAFQHEPRVTLLRKDNGGKAGALNTGLDYARGEIAIGLDADTLFAPNTISLLVRHFHDPRVAAVAGNVKVGNRVNLWTLWQSLEYIASQNFDRRAYAALNCITVVPGAIGAWRRSVILEAGGYLADTLAEDTDLTLRVRRLGYVLKTENDALAYTEAPDNVRALAKQRFRWAFGTLQCLWKHRKVLFRRKYGALGFVALPTLWLFQMVFQAVSPVVDLMILVAIWSGNFPTVLFYYGLFFFVDLIGAAMAVWLDDEDWRLLLWMFWQRFVYRQVMYYVIFRSVMAAFRGHHVGWGKLQRKGTATAAR